MRRILFAGIMLAGCWTMGAELSKASHPSIRARENFYAAVFNRNGKQQAELLLAALRDQPDSTLYFQELRSCKLDRATQVEVGKQLLELGKKHPECAMFILQGMLWNRFQNMERQEILDILEPALEKNRHDPFMYDVIFCRRLEALCSEGDFSELKKIIPVRKKEHLLFVAKIACLANFFEPEKYGKEWQIIQKQLKETKEKNPEFLNGLEIFYANIGDFANAHRVRRLYIPLNGDNVPPLEIRMEVYLLCEQKRFAEAQAFLEKYEKRHPKLCTELAALINNSRLPKEEPRIEREKMLKMMQDENPEIVRSAAVVLLFEAEKKRDIPLYRQIRQVLMKYELKPDELNAVGYVGVELGEDIAENRKLIEKALFIVPDSHAFLDSLAWAQFREKDYKTAAKTIRKALYSVAPVKSQLDTLGVLFMHAGDIEAALGNREKAVYFYKKAMQCVNDPELDRDEVRKKLEKLEAAK